MAHGSSRRPRGRTAHHEDHRQRRRAGGRRRPGPHRPRPPRPRDPTPVRHRTRAGGLRRGPPRAPRDHRPAGRRRRCRDQGHPHHDLPAARSPDRHHAGPAAPRARRDGRRGPSDGEAAAGRLHRAGRPRPHRRARRRRGGGGARDPQQRRPARGGATDARGGRRHRRRPARQRGRRRPGRPRRGGSEQRGRQPQRAGRAARWPGVGVRPSLASKRSAKSAATARETSTVSVLPVALHTDTSSRIPSPR